ncbi:hypothetical protein [Flavobacterium sp. LS1P3]|uniref:hypothetical protein n=1 Tax=Flavobacterium sp. LS1P3 TaxID=3401720 RepID=UPI003AAC1896
MSSFTNAYCLVIIPENTSKIESGQEIEVYLFPFLKLPNDIILILFFITVYYCIFIRSGWSWWSKWLFSVNGYFQL